MLQILWVSFQDNETTVMEDCSERDSLFNLCYIMGSVSVGVSSFPFGVFFDRFGLRVGRIVARYVLQCLILPLMSFCLLETYVFIDTLHTFFVSEYFTVYL